METKVVTQVDNFIYGMMLLITSTDTSDFEEKEIRSIAGSYLIKDLEKRTSLIKLKNKEPQPADYGINKDKEIYRFNKEWIKIKQ